MTLTVDPDALLGYSRQIDRAGNDATEIRHYLGRYAEAGTGGELFSLARSAHQHAVGVIDGTLNRIACLLDASAPELAAAGRYYRSTDRAAAYALDRVLPAGIGQRATLLEMEVADNSCAPPPFVDTRYVVGQLTQPGEADNPSNPLAWMDYLSPSSWANSAFDIVFGFDPIGWIQQRVFGDWEALAAMSPVITNIGGALHDLAYNVQAGALTLQPLWRGRAGDAAHTYFTTTANAVAFLRQPLGDISHAYQDMTDAVWAIGEALGGVVKALLDSAIIAGIAAAAGTVTAETGVGAAVGYGVAAAEVANMLRLWGDATALYQNLSAAVNTFRALLNRQLSGLATTALPALPDGGRYDHPLAGAPA
jgi:hypothetical protein